MFYQAKMKLLLLILFLCGVCADTDRKQKSGKKYLGDASYKSAKRYRPDWKDLDTRPLPEWYDKAKVGIFLHWGVYSVPSFGSEWFWINWKGHTKNYNISQFMKKNYPPSFSYQDFAPMFTAEFFDPDEWATLFQKAGAKYIVLTSKHHEGYTLFPSQRSFSWNSVDVGPHRDLVGDLAKAVRNKTMKFGVYHSLFEWFNPLYLADKNAQYKTSTFPNIKLRPEIEQIVRDYKPSVLWADGDWEAYDTYWNSTSIVAWLYNDSPVKDEIVVNDRWGRGCGGKHGDFYNIADRYNPGVLQSHKWENAFTVDKKSWGFRRNMLMTDVMSIEKLLYNVITAVSCGGNALINVGPTKEGTIAPIFQERLLALGEWLGINGEAIYNSSPWTHQNDTTNGNVWYTCIKAKYNAAHPTATPGSTDAVTAIYATSLIWPKNSLLKVKDLTYYLHSGNYQVELLGNEGSYLNWTISEGDVEIQLPDRATVKSKHAWVLKVTHK